MGPLPGTTFISCSLTFLSQAKLKPHSLEPRSQEQPLLQPKQVLSSQPPSGTCCGWDRPKTPEGCREREALLSQQAEVRTQVGPDPQIQRGWGQALEPLTSWTHSSVSQKILTEHLYCARPSTHFSLPHADFGGKWALQPPSHTPPTQSLSKVSSGWGPVWA